VALDVILDALASEPRRQIVARLSAGPLPTPELGRRFGFTKQALSKHIAILEGAGLVRAPLTEVTGWLAEVERGWQASLDRLDEVLRSTDG
jgi:DNA-binding transcriptional ArsR family regulator